MEERRLSKRIELKIDVDINLSSAQDDFKFESKDISREGVCLIAPRPIPVNTLISLSFILPETKDILFIEGIVVWIQEVKENKKVYHVGVKFTSMLGEYHDIIDKYISNLTFRINKNNF